MTPQIEKLGDIKTGRGAGGGGEEGKLKKGESSKIDASPWSVRPNFPWYNFICSAEIIKKKTGKKRERERMPEKQT